MPVRSTLSRRGPVALAIVLAVIPVLATAGHAAAAPVLAQAAGAVGPGAYWLVATDGGIFSFGGVPFEGSTGAIRLNQPIAAMAQTPDGRGYWLVARDGGIFAFGDAAFHGSPAGLPPPSRPNSPVVAIQPTGDGGGYWVAAADGAVYTFGDARFFGSQAGPVLPGPIVGMAVTPDGGGYWLAGADGSVYGFGDAALAGSARSFHLAAAIVGMAAAPDGAGYWLVATDGGIFTFGSATYHGSTGAIRLNRPVVGMAATQDGGGYWLVASDGGIFSFGDASFRGSMGGRRLNAPIVGMATGHTLDPYVPGNFGYDISFPQCSGNFPPSGGFGVVGVNNGRAFTHNPCFASEAAWAGGQLAIYMNLNAPPPGDPEGLSGPAGQCAGDDTGCMAYNFGYNAAVDSFSTATAAGASAGVWWLDVETANTWDSNTFNNERTIQGALDALGAEGVEPGIYSTSFQWGIIAGSFAPGTPVWVATGAGEATAIAYCDPSHAFGGGTTWLTQFQSPGVPFDQDYACPAA